MNDPHSDMDTAGCGGSASGADPQQVMVISLDGTTWDILQPWMQAGFLPNLASLTWQGVWGRLQSTIPPVTIPAWTTFQTGMNPGKHGLFHFTRYQPGSYETPLVNARDIAQPTLSRILSDAGRRVATINVPMTYPPRPVNGLVVAGLLSPSPQQAFWPPELYSEVVAAVGGYQVWTSIDAFDYLGVRGFVERVTALARQRAAAARYLFQKEDWDFFMVHFQSTDILQHPLWAWADPRHPDYDSKPEEEKALVRGFYETLDGLVGELCALAGPKRAVIVMSDHGFGPAMRRVYLNQWLLDEGLLAAPGLSSLRGRLLGWLETVVRRADVLKLRRRLIRPRGKGDQLVQWVKRDALIKWSETKAFAPSGPFFGRIYLNTVGREAQGVVPPGPAWEALRDSIADRLLTLRDPTNGQTVVEKVWRREEIYDGDRAGELPDLVVQPADGYQIVTEFRRGLLMEPMPTFHSGTHRMEGILALRGPGIQSGRVIDGAVMTDMAPTILYLMGLPVPSGMDGHVLKDAIDPSLLASRPVCFSEQGDEGVAGTGAFEPAYSADDSEEVQSRLAGLGYLS
jgi:predicted AlkP superfamily phosphohydrolase/phosphomutase